MNYEERYIRQSDIVPEKIQEDRIAVVGVGAVGRQVALQLAAMGAMNLTLYDPDTVSVENLAVQGFPEDQLGIEKVHAVKAECLRSCPNATIPTAVRRLKPTDEVPDVLFCCVDTMAARDQIFGWFGAKVRLWLDSRLAAEAARILTAWDDDSRKRYRQTLFTDEEGLRGRCTAKTTLYCANITAGLLVSSYTQELRGFVLNPDVSINLLDLQ